jgi:hypothetical protein
MRWRRQNRGMQGLDGVANRRSWAILTRSFPMENGAQAQKRKNGQTRILCRTKLALRPITSVASRPRPQGSAMNGAAQTGRAALDPAPGSQELANTRLRPVF